MAISNDPYINVVLSSTKRLYNPDYGDNRVCKCGHTYYRHFDSYEDMDACGCKYCGCDSFVERGDIDSMIPNEDLVICKRCNVELDRTMDFVSCDCLCDTCDNAVREGI